ncbi:phenylacetate--CoA ligase family protein [Candidatus Bipolaricaulota bacterium]|nr:phenylacetate--CoA ligase family protein [Candidatus Bipolaricaulota bacterium]
MRFKLGKTPADVDRVLSHLVRNAYQNSSSYRQTLDKAGLSVDGFRQVEDLQRLPIVDKGTLFHQFPLRDVLHRRADPSRCVRAGTSGSTGLPLYVFMSKGEAFFRQVLLLFAWRRARRLRLPLTIADVGSCIEAEDTVSLTKGGLVKIVRISIAIPAEQQLQHLMQHRPNILTGYPTSLRVLAEAIRSKSGRTPFLKLLATRGEVLHDETRVFLENAFGCRVSDYYNCEEVGNMAWECPADASVLHVNTDACVLEIVDESGHPAALGVEGRVIVTNLFNCTMPFIRYDLHDRGQILHQGGTRCACGSRNPSMAVLQGRDDDYVYLPDGRKVSPRLIATTVGRAMVRRSPQTRFDLAFRRFQVVQDARDQLTIRIIPEQGELVDFQPVIAPVLRALYPKMHCSVELVDSLPVGPSGKFKKVISNIDVPS